MMQQNSILKEETEQDFLDTVEDLNSVMQLFQVMREIEELSSHPDKSDPERLAQLQSDYETTKKKLKFANIGASDA